MIANEFNDAPKLSSPSHCFSVLIITLKYGIPFSDIEESAATHSTSPFMPPYLKKSNVSILTVAYLIILT